MNLIGTPDFSIRLQRFFDIRGERNVAPTLDPSIQPVVLVADFTEPPLDTDPTSTMREYYASVALAPGVTEFAEMNLGVQPDEQLIVRLLEIELGCFTDPCNLQVGIGTFAAFNPTNYAWGVRRGGAQVLQSDRLTVDETVSTPGVDKQRIRHYSLAAFTSLGRQLTLAVGPGSGIGIWTEAPGVPVTIGVKWREEPLRPVPGLSVVAGEPG